MDIDAASPPKWGDDLGLTDLSLAQASTLIQSRRLATTQITSATLRRVAACDHELNSYITVIGEDAMAQARQLDLEQMAGKLRGPLHGIPIALKDNIDTAGIPTSSASLSTRFFCEHPALGEVWPRNHQTDR